MNRASTKRHGYFYKGVIRDGNKIIWECSHAHDNRDQDSWHRPGEKSPRVGASHCAECALRQLEVNKEVIGLAGVND